MITQKSFDNKKIIQLNNNGKNVYIGSKYNMSREILMFKEKFLSINRNYGMVIFGAAGGEWIETLAEEFNERYVVFVEPIEKLKLELEKRLEFLNIDIPVLSLESEDFENELKNSMNRRFMELIVFSNYDLVFPKEVYKLKETMRNRVVDRAITENTAITFAQDWIKNYFGNLPLVLKGEKLNQYKNSYYDKPAIIVSAGPSLEKNIELLKGNEDKFIIITGIRTLTTLKNEGIKVDFACVIDGSEDMYKVSKEALDYDTPLFFSEGANKKIIDEYKGKKIYFTSPSFYNMNKQLGRISTDILYQGGSVAHSCTAIANYLGCNPIVFIGQDLAFTNNQIHAKNAIIEGEKLHTEKYDLYVKDINGNDIPTSYSLDSFRKSFEKFIGDYEDKIFINATEGGANIEGTEIKSLKEVINMFNEKLNKSYIDEFKEITSDIGCVVENLNVNLNEIEKIKKFAKEAIFENKNLLNKFLSNNKAYKNSLKTLDYIDEKFRQKQNELMLINSLFAPIIKEIDIAFYDEKVGNFQSETEHIKFISDKGKILYENINKSIEFAVPYIKKVINKLEVLVNETE